MAIIDNPTLYFSSTIWTGNGVDDRNIVIDGTGMQPDFVWIKSRNDTDNHRLVDSVRGATKHLESDGSGAEQTSSNVKAFTSTGVTLSTNGSVNANSELYASWSWKAGTSFTNDASATGIGTLDSSGSVNATAGFSIISFTGTETSSQSVAHGLGAVPELIISKSRDVVDNWMVYHGTYSSQQYQSLNLTTAVASSANIWTSLPTSTVINIGDNAGVNDDGAMIMYAFRSVQGYSKFGSYTGNGNADGTFVYTGFKPAFLMIKGSDGTDNWQLFDSARSPQNDANMELLYPNLSNAEDNGDQIDLISNGFKARKSTTAYNSSGSTFIYMCFASNPFVSSTGVPATAR